MAGSASNVVENRIANGFFRGEQIPVPTELYLALFVGPPGEDGTSGNEVTTGTGWYARADLTANGPIGGAFSEPVDGVITNLKSIDFAAVKINSVIITHTAIFDAPTGGNMLAYADLVQPKIYEVNDIATLPVGVFTITVT